MISTPRMVLAALVSILTLGSAEAQSVHLTDDERRELHLAGIMVEDDEDLRKRRALCDQGRMPAFRQALEEEGTPFPEAHIFCRANLREESKRGRINYYRKTEDYIAINQAVRQGQTVYLNYKNERKALSCETAYDTGYAYGWNQPDAELQPQLKDMADVHAQQCFAGGELRIAFGYLAGVHHAQADRAVIEEAGA